MVEEGGIEPPPAKPVACFPSRCKNHLTASSVVPQVGLEPTESWFWIKHVYHSVIGALYGRSPQIQTAFSPVKSRDFIIKVCNPYRNTLSSPTYDCRNQRKLMTCSCVTIMCFYMVQPRGIEPLSTILQTAAMTTSAKVAKLVLLPRIKLGFRPYQGRVLSLYDKSRLLSIFPIIRRQQRRVLNL